MPTSGDQTQSQSGGKFKKKQGRRGPLKSKLKDNEFYCLTCRNKRRVRATKNIEIVTAKNGRKVAKAKCSAKDCTRTLVKILSNDQAEKMGKK